jgi:hypothetical protein
MKPRAARRTFSSQALEAGEFEACGLKFSE